MNKYLLLLLLFSSLYLRGENIKKVEIYGLEYFSCYIVNINQKDLNKKYEQYIININNGQILESNLEQSIKELKTNKQIGPLPSDYRIKLIIHREKGKKEIYYIGSSNSGVVDNNGILYKNNNFFLSSVYSFFPSYFFKDFYKILNKKCIPKD